MAINKELLGPKDESEHEAFAVEALVFSVQISLQKAMNRRGMSNKALAEKLGMTPARVSQIFASKGANLTLKTIAKIQNALGEEFEFVRKGDIRVAPRDLKVERFRPFLIGGTSSIWKERRAHNDNKEGRRLAA